MMARRESSPAFQLYVKDWRSSRSVMRMSFAERGMYLEMLLEQWESLSLPDDPRAVARIIGGTDEEWIAAWPALRRKFCDRRGRPRNGEDLTTDYSQITTWNAKKQIVNVKLEIVRRDKKKYKKAAKIGGSRRAESANRNDDGTYGDGAHPAVHPAVHPAAHPGQSSTSSSTATASSPSSSSASSWKKREPPNARSRMVVFKGNRLVVFDWQLDDLIGLVGVDFGFDDWFDALDARCVAGGLIPPERDGGAWLKAETLKEANLRGMNLRVASAQFDTTDLAQVESILRRGGVIQ
jgi:uncharacterized protein YdaU (DUF1376 family)